VSNILNKIADLQTEVPTAVSNPQLHQATAVARDELVVSETIEPDHLRRLLESLVREDCVHSWRNFGPDGTLAELLNWENELRPTKLFFFYLKRDGETHLIGASAVANSLTRDFPHRGFCVLGRCYIMPQFRGRGFYRQILHYRLEHCRSRFGNELNAVHIGSVNERISRVITNHRLNGWPKFTHLGEEALRVAGQIRTVGAYLMLMPDYVRRMSSGLAGPLAPPRVVQLREALAGIESCDIHNLGMLTKNAYEEGCRYQWFDECNSSEIEQLLLFCSSIPLVTEES